MTSLRMMAAFPERLFFDANDVLYNVSLLPRDVRAKIFIRCMRNYWRAYVPLTAQIPSWFGHKVEVEDELYQSRLKNIHFCHLSYNCLPELKKWIPGCQCEFCKNEAVDSRDTIAIISRDYFQFLRLFPSYHHTHNVSHSLDFNGYYESDDSENEEPRIIHRENPDHDTLCGSAFEDPVQKNLREDTYNFTFSEDALDNFSSFSSDDEGFITLSSDDDD